MRGATLLLLAAASTALAQYRGPEVDACRAYARQEAKRNGAAKDVIIELDRELLIERRRGKIGSQPVSSVLTGNGAVVYPGTPSAELSFVCLLASEKRPVFFAWLARRDAPALAQCTRDEELRGAPQACLEMLLNVAETELGELYGRERQELLSRGESALAVYEKSKDAWREYRAAECTRRANAGGEGERLGCMVELTRRRAEDLRR